MSYCVSYSPEDYCRAKWWMNTETGELLTKSEAKEQFVCDYDGADPTNLIDFYDLYVPVTNRPKRYSVAV